MRTPLYALLNVNAAGFDQLLSSWAFYGLALLARRRQRGAARARARRARPPGSPTSVAFGAWFMGSVYYASGAAGRPTLYSFPHRRTPLLVPFAVAAAAFAVGMLVRSRVKPFQPTLLLDGLIVSLAAGALRGRRDVATVSCAAPRRAPPCSR